MKHFALIVVLAGVFLSASPTLSQRSIIQPGTLFSFTENRGQWDGNVLFSMMDRGIAAWFTADGLYLPQSAKTLVPVVAEAPAAVAQGFGVEFVRPSATSRISGENQLIKRSNFYLSPDASNWHENVPNWSVVRYSDVWDGVDIVYSGIGKGLRQRIHVRDLEALKRIALRCSDAVHGSLIFHGAHDAYGTPIRGMRMVQDRSGIVGFSMPTPSVIDSGFVPDGGLTLDTEFSTYFGTPNNEWLEKIRIDQYGSCFMLGAADYPRPNARFKVQVPFPRINDQLGSEREGTYSADTFVVVQSKILCDGKTVEYSSYLTYLRTSESIFGDMNITPEGETFIAGSLPGAGIPITPGAMRVVKQSNYADGFIMRLSPQGQLLYSSYLGTPDAEQTNHTIAFDKEGNVWIGGTIHRPSHNLDFHIWPEHLTAQAFHSQLTIENHSLAGGHFILKLNATCDSILYGTYMPFTFSGQYFGNLQIDSKGCIALVMHAHDRGGGVLTPHLLKNAFQPTLEGKAAMYVARVDPAKKELVFGTFFSGSNYDGVWDRNMVLDDDDNIIVFGSAASIDLPIRNPLPGTGPNLYQNLFIAKFSPTGELLKSSYLGGSGYDEAQSIVRDFKGNYLLLWYTEDQSSSPCQPTYPITHIIPQEGLQCSGTVLTILDSGLTRIKYSALMTQETLLNPPRAWQGSYHNEHGLGADSIGYVYVAGTAYDQHHPTHNALNAVKPGGFDWAIMRMKPKLPEYDMLSLKFILPDSIYSSRKPHSMATFPFEIAIELENIHPEYTVNDPSVELDIPPALKMQTIFSKRLQQYSGDLHPGDKITMKWRVRVDSAYMLAFPFDTVAYLAEEIVRPIRATVRYHTRNINQSCPEMIFDKDTSLKLANDIIPYDDLQCEFPEGIMVVNAVDDQDPHSMKQALITCTFVNHTGGSLSGYGAELVLGAGMGLDFAEGDSARKPIPTITPWQTVSVNWLVDLKKLRNARQIRLYVRVLNKWGGLVSECEAEIRIPEINTLLCRNDGIQSSTFTEQTSTWDPVDVTPVFILDNHLDSLLTDFELRLDLSAAPNLSLASGESASYTIDSLSAHTAQSFRWNLDLVGSISADTTAMITMEYRHQGETGWMSCSQPVELLFGNDSVVCYVEMPDSIRLGDVMYEPFDVRVIIQNAGMTPIPATTAVITLPARIHSSQATTVNVPALPVSADYVIVIACTADRTAFDVSAEVSVSGSDATGDITFSCSDATYIPRFAPEMSCMLIVPDTLVYDDSTRQYIPFEVTLALQNHLDTVQTNINGRLSFTGLPMLSLSPGMTESQHLASIPAGGTANFVWSARFDGGTTDTMRAEIVGEYNTDAIAEWRQCTHPLFLVNTVWEPVGTGAVPSSTAFYLWQNYPNPVRAGEMTVIRYSIANAEMVLLRVYNILGEHVATWQLGNQAPGKHTFVLPTTGLSPGVYQYVLSTRSGTADRRLFVK